MALRPKPRKQNLIFLYRKRSHFQCLPPIQRGRKRADKLDSSYSAKNGKIIVFLPKIIMPLQMMTTDTARFKD